MGDRIYHDFRQMQIPVEWVNASNDSRHYHPNEDSIKIITMHSSKGLEFPVICVPGLGYMPNKDQSTLEEARLMYVAMTRAIDQLIVTSHSQSLFTERLEKAMLKATVSGR
jgi:superfamily I DNA/RNA helicase